MKKRRTAAQRRRDIWKGVGNIRCPVPRKKAKPRGRSKFEDWLMECLDASKVRYSYEAHTFQIKLPIPGAKCEECGSPEVYKDSKYTPDFFLPHKIVEAKGKFTPHDRKRVVALLDGHPSLRPKFAMLFQRDNWMTKARKRRYTDWCAERNIECAVGTFPQEWLK